MRFKSKVSREKKSLRKMNTRVTFSDRLMHGNDKLRSEKEMKIGKCQRHKYQTANQSTAYGKWR